jgi:UDP-N-acetylmuramoyl-tripeptide--D-alanyl-D-alanine ligase
MAAALASLAMLRERRPGRLIAVLGDMLELGPTQAELHRAVGAQAAALGLDAVLGFGPCAAAIVEGARAGGLLTTHRIERIDDTPEGPVTAANAAEEAAAWVREQLGEQPGAALFKASRGVRLERVLARLA